MRVALVGWDTDDAVIEALAGLGTEVLAFTRWFPGQVEVEAQPGGWIKYRCPHRLGGGRAEEAEALRESILRRTAQMGAVLGYDVIHALDPMARATAEELRKRNLTGAFVASLVAGDVEPEGDALATITPDCWIAHHPWVADRWLARDAARGSPLTLIASAATLTAAAGGPTPVVGREGLLVAWIPRGANLDVAAVTTALAKVRQEVPRLAAVVMGTNPSAEALRRRLASRRLLLRSAPGVCDPDPQAWSAWLRAATVVAIAGAGESLPDDPAAWAAWSFGVPVVGLDGLEAEALADAIDSALHDRHRFENGVRAGAALAEQRLSPEGVALGWLRTYLAARDRGHRSSQAGRDSPDPRPVLAGEGRSRLTLVALSPREAYASWHVRPDDRAQALEWLGPDATRSTLAIRLFDITHLTFNGTNAHTFWDVELPAATSFRTIPLAGAGRSLVASLGLRSPKGYLHPLAHAGPTHLPREEPTYAPPSRWLQALPRR
ncbi:MAG TPA: DUF4912 domain-containing protein [Isosphaeraceae bacterium]|jgi:hypothetical protein|nr:DUF4912 domain-containing protein [Isosphaeraceae bacterium]